MGELERWAAANGWSFTANAAAGPSWAGWSPAMIDAEAKRLQPNDELTVKDAGPFLTGMLDGTEVSLACVRWTQGFDEEDRPTTPYNGSVFVAVRMPAPLPPMTVRPRPGVAPKANRSFGTRFLVQPEEAQEHVPESLRQAHLAREVPPWTLHDGRLVSICRHLLYDDLPNPKHLLPAADRALLAVRLLTPRTTRSEPPRAR
jgi:hypothetical protein